MPDKEEQELKWNFLEFEPKILNLAIHNRDFYFVLKENIKRSYFINPLCGTMFKFLVLTQSKISAIPSKDIYCYGLKKYFKDPIELDKALGMADNMYNNEFVSEVEKEFIINEIDMWIKHHKITAAIMRSVDYLKINQYDSILEEMKTAVKFSSKVDRGMDLTEEVEKRYTKFVDETQVVPYPLPTANRFTQGGMHRGEINIIMAGSGYGKSAFLINQAVESMRQNYNVVYISLELNSDQIANRIDRCMWDLGSEEAKQEYQSIQGKWTEFKKGFAGKLFIKYANAYSFTSGDLMRYLDQLKMSDDFVPDVLIVDYLELMQSSQYSKQIKEHERQQFITAELRNLAGEMDVCLLTATQSNRKIFEIDGEVPVNEILAVGESLGKIKIADTFAIIIATKEERAEDKSKFRFIKNRHGIINTDIKMNVNYDKMKFVEEII